MNMVIREGHNHTESSIALKVSGRTRKVEIHLAIEGSFLAFFSTSFGQVFVGNVGSSLGVLFRGRGPHKPVFVLDIVRIQSLMINRNSIEYNNGDTKVLLLRRFSFFSGLKSGDVKLKDKT